MSKLSKMFSLVALLGALMMVGGCGGDDAPVVTNPSATASFTATINANGTATTATATTAATPPGTPGYLATVKAELPANTVITAKDAAGNPKALTAPLSFTFTAPADSTATFSGTNGVPVPTGFTTLASTSGAVDVQLTGAASATFNPAIIITMPVPGKAVGAVIKVYTVTGTTYTLLDSPTVTNAGFVSFQVSNLSWKVCDPNPDPSSPTTTVQPTTTTVPATTTIGPTTTTVPATVPTTVPATTTTVPTTVPVTTTTVAPSCVACHGIPPTTGPTAGEHAVHVNTAGLSCAFCHGAGYSNNTTNATLHLNGVRDVVGTIGWNATSRTCANSCHGSKPW